MTHRISTHATLWLAVLALLVASQVGCTSTDISDNDQQVADGRDLEDVPVLHDTDKFHDAILHDTTSDTASDNAPTDADSNDTTDVEDNDITVMEDADITDNVLQHLLPPPEHTGGTLTSQSTGAAWRFMEMADNLSLEQLQRFSQGREFFDADWNAAPGTRTLLDGLGPLFHDVSCASCHPSTTGRPPTLGDNGQVHSGLLIRLARPTNNGWEPDPIFGTQFQPRSITSSIAPEGKVTWRNQDEITALADYTNLIAPEFQLETHPSYGPLHTDTRAGGRASPQLIGLGLLDLVPDEAILALEDPDDLDGDGISGRAHRLSDNRLGRFGWKATQPTLLTQSAAAFAGDMGITSPVVPHDDCTESQTSCTSALNGGNPEITAPHLAALVEFQRYVGVPAARREAPQEILEQGARHFQQAGCDSCHVPSLVTGDIPEHPLLSNQRFYAFTDLLLHDMGPGLADVMSEGNATPSEWRTPPLWGLGIVEARSSQARFLHDGRARNLHEAILWHGGEAEPARIYVQQLEPDELEALLTFVRSL